MASKKKPMDKKPAEDDDKNSPPSKKAKTSGESFEDFLSRIQQQRVKVRISS